MILTVCYKIILSWTAILWHCDVGSLKKMYRWDKFQHNDSFSKPTKSSISFSLINRFSSKWSVIFMKK